MSPEAREGRGARLAARRRAAGLTQAQFAHRAAVGVCWLKDVEKGRRPIHDSDVPRLRRILEQEERGQRRPPP